MEARATPAILDPDAVRERADQLAGAILNGLRLALVTIGPPAGPDEALVEVFFLNAHHVATILTELQAAPLSIGDVFLVTGGHRRPAGKMDGQVKCTALAAGSTDEQGALVSLVLTVAPIGDYSTYGLELHQTTQRIDPFFAELPFKFRPGCFVSDCDPARSPGRPAPDAPAIDYLAKDYDSFRHTLMTAMAERVPGWQVTSEADLDQVLIDLFAAAADELSDFQDRTMGEAYLSTARNRISLARHARLVDYHVHQGNQASTWLVVIVAPLQQEFSLAEELVVWAGHPAAPAGWVHFATRERLLKNQEKAVLDPLLNAFALHTWSDAQPALRAGSTSADIVSTAPGAGQLEAEHVRDLVTSGRLARLVVEEKLNPLTGRPTGSDPRKRQLLRLTRQAQALWDPMTLTWVTRVRWVDADALRSDYCFTTTCPQTGRVAGVSAFHGNLLRVHQGRPVRTAFVSPDTELAADTDDAKYRHFGVRSLFGRPRGARCELPFAPLAYLPTPPGGEVAPRSTLQVEVVVGGVADRWDEVPSLVHSDDSAEEGDHFVVETDELQRSTLRFGDGVNGRRLPDGAVVRCEYQLGEGTAGNVGMGSLTHARPLAGKPGAIAAVWNPFDVTDGRDPEPVEKVLRNAPEAYCTRQLRAITLADYRRRAEEVPGVSRAVAEYAWTGSWRTVRIVVDPVGSIVLDAELAELMQRVAEHLEAVRLLGEDLEIRPPRFVPLSIDVGVCVHPDFWPRDVRFALEQELSDGWTSDGRRGFFHPDEWTFGQSLHRSALAGRIHAVAGVEHITSIKMRRFDAVTPGAPAGEVLTVRFDEIVLVQNDPDHRELGTLELHLAGGRR